MMGSKGLRPLSVGLLISCAEGKDTGVAPAAAGQGGGGAGPVVWLQRAEGRDEGLAGRRAGGRHPPPRARLHPKFPQVLGAAMV